MLKESEVERPAFAPLAVGMEFCVLVTWPNGVEARINDFGYQEDAPSRDRLAGLPNPW
jgi:hypothetical protein